MSKQPRYNLSRQIIKKIVPNATPITECSTDCWIEELLITNPSGGSIDVYITDNSTPTPLYLLPNSTVPDKGIVTGEFHDINAMNDSCAGMFMPGGFTWQATLTGLHGYILYWV